MRVTDIEYYRVHLRTLDMQQVGLYHMILCNVLIYTAVLLAPADVVPIYQTLNSLLQIRGLHIDHRNKNIK